MIRIAVIGDIGSGKSYIAKKFGYPVFNADAEVAKLYRKSKKYYKKLKKKFPEHITSFPIKKNKLSEVVMHNKHNLKKIVIAYEPVWSIGTGRVPSSYELRNNIITIKKFIKKHFKIRHEPKILYGGSVDKKSVYNFKSIKELIPCVA